MKKITQLGSRKQSKLSDLIKVHHSTSILLVTGIFIIAVIVLLTSIAIFQGRSNARSVIGIITANLTSVLADGINNSVQQIDLGLLAILDEVSKQQRTGHGNEQSILDLISREDARHPEAMGFCVFGPDGRFRYGLSNIINRNVDLSERDEFRQLRDTPDAKLIVTPPFEGPVAQVWLIAVARRITNPDGSFGGAIYSAIPIRNIIKKFSTLNLGPGGSVALYHSSFQLAARFPELKVGTTTISEQLRAVIVSGIQSVNFDNLSPVDGVRRTGHARKVGELPYYISLALADDDWLVEWRRNRNYLIILAAILIGVVLLGTIVSVARDIADRKEAEKALREGEVQLQSILASTADGILAVDREGKVIRTNRRFSELWRIPQSLLDKKDDQILLEQVLDQLIDPQEFLRKFQGLCQSDTELMGTMHFKDGRVFERFTAPLILNDVMIGRVWSFRDMTERKHAEAQRARLEAQLRESQKMQALGTLAGGVAHDFNNALAAILGNLELARQDVGPGHGALVSLEEIGKASRRAKDLVQQILAFSRRQKLERKPTSLALVVVESARLLRTTFPAGVELRVDCKADAPPVLADATQIKQILLNLCTNALHAVQDQGRPGLVEIGLSEYSVGGVLHNGPERRSIGERASLREGHYACLSIRDNGPGMDEATRARIFEPFFTTKQVSKGTGLGLSVVHSIVQAHEACVEVESSPGEGTAFCIYFPATEESVQELTTPTPDTAPVHGKGKHVLYVDDEEAIVFLMTRLLERQGFRVSGYTDPQEALAAARAYPEQFDLVVTDYNMPGLDGLEVAQALKQIRADLPVVLASGYITEELRAKAPAAGISELIYKPNTVDDLCEAVARYANLQATPPT